MAADSDGIETGGSGYVPRLERAGRRPQRGEDRLPSLGERRLRGKPGLDPGTRGAIPGESKPMWEYARACDVKDGVLVAARRFENQHGIGGTRKGGSAGEHAVDILGAGDMAVMKHEDGNLETPSQQREGSEGGAFAVVGGEPGEGGWHDAGHSVDSDETRVVSLADPGNKVAHPSGV